MKYLVTFHTTAQAMAMEKKCGERSLPGRLIPVPRQISSGCGMAWCVPAENREEIHAMLINGEVDYYEEYEILI